MDLLCDFAEGELFDTQFSLLYLRDELPPVQYAGTRRERWLPRYPVHFVYRVHVYTVAYNVGYRVPATRVPGLYYGYTKVYPALNKLKLI